LLSNAVWVKNNYQIDVKLKTDYLNNIVKQALSFAKQLEVDNWYNPEGVEMGVVWKILTFCLSELWMSPAQLNQLIHQTKNQNGSETSQVEHKIVGSTKKIGLMNDYSKNFNEVHQARTEHFKFVYDSFNHNW